MKDYEFTDYEGDSIEVSPTKNVVLGWCIYIYNTQAHDKADVVEISYRQVVCPDEVGVALPLDEAKKLRDYIDSAIAYCEAKKGEQK